MECGIFRTLLGYSKTYLLTYQKLTYQKLTYQKLTYQKLTYQITILLTYSNYTLLTIYYKTFFNKKHRYLYSKHLFTKLFLDINLYCDILIL
jgi:hypothetical protein